MAGAIARRPARAGARSPGRSGILGFCLALIVLSACGSSESKVPLTTFQGDGFSVGYPPGWRGCQTQLGDIKATAARFEGPARPDGVSAGLQVANEGTQRQFDHALRFHDLLFQVSPGYRQLQRKDAEVEGANRATEIRFSDRPLVQGAGGETVVLGVLVLAEAANGNVVALTITAGEMDFEAMGETVDAILASVRVGTNGPSQMNELTSCQQATP